MGTRNWAIIGKQEDEITALRAEVARLTAEVDALRKALLEDDDMGPLTDCDMEGSYE
jgi:hypothetical protein